MEKKKKGLLSIMLAMGKPKDHKEENEDENNMSEDENFPEERQLKAYWEAQDSGDTKAGLKAFKKLIQHRSDMDMGEEEDEEEDEYSDEE